jgi:NADH-quinone oxidoreductase subunit I
MAAGDINDYRRGGGEGRKGKRRSDDLGFGGYVLSPMLATIKTFFRGLRGRPRTVLYPYEDTDTPEFWGKGHYWRGMHEVDWSRCIGCGLCSRVCPTQCIVMEDIPEGEAGVFYLRSKQDEKKQRVQRPSVDIGRCSFCGNCEEICPVKAWHMTNDFELANKDRDALKVDARALKVKKERGRPKRTVNRIGERPVYIFDNCKGCQACIRNCSVQAVDLVDMGRDENNKPLRRVFFHYEDCIGCGACVEDCKFKALHMDRADRAGNDKRVLDFMAKKGNGKETVE